MSEPLSTPPGDRPRKSPLTKRPDHSEIEDQIARREERRIRSRHERRHQVWFGLGMFGLVGWSVAIPTLLGAAIGMWIDRTWQSRHSWTLMLLVCGLVMGCVNAWWWVQREGKSRDD